MQTRTPLRLQGYDYATPGAYFVTLCTHDRACLFGDVTDAEMRPSIAGEMVAIWLREIESAFAAVRLDAYVVMPNHVHAVLCLGVREKPAVGADLRVGPRLRGDDPGGRPTMLASQPSTGAHTGAPLPGELMRSDGPPVGADLRVGPRLRGDDPGGRPTMLASQTPTGAHTSAPLPGELMRSDGPPVGADLRVGPRLRSDDPGGQPTMLASQPSTGAHTGAPLPESAAREGASLPTIMQWFKTMTTNAYILGVRDSGWPRFAGKLWQRSYYEHVLRSEGGLQRAREYIAGNPARWREDPENPRISRG